MNFRKSINYLLIALCCGTFACTPEAKPIEIDTATSTAELASEKAAILKVLNDETKAAFTRDYEGWQDKWVHEPYVTKTYMDFSDSTMTETLGWGEISDFVRTYLEEHPEPEPLPTMINDISVRIYGTGAWVSYEQNDADQGLKRETRLMEKVNGAWKIAGMQTTIYGLDAEN